MVVMGTETEAQRKGRLAEERAAEYLRALGYSIVARNWRARRGELDIVAQDGAELVFVEVRARWSGGWGTPEETVGWEKRRRLLSAAQSFAVSRAYEGSCRFDVVAYDGLTLRHLRDAFRA